MVIYCGYWKSRRPRAGVISLLRDAAGDESGQDLIEYALLSAVLALGCITVLLQLTQIREFMAAAGAALDAAI